MRYIPILLSFFSFVALAGVTPTPTHTIDKLKVDNRSQPARVEVYVNEEVINPGALSGGPCASNVRYSFSYDQGGDVLFSMLLAAKMSQQSVEFFIEGCFDNNPQIKIIQLP